jgi:polyisoprenoid-binding protein YceI
MLALLLLTASAAVQAEVVPYRIEPAGGKLITLEVEKTGLMRGKKHVIVFPKYGGKLLFDAAAPANSKVEVTIDSRSAEVRDTWLSEKDQKKVRDEALNNMLAASQYPEMRFASTKVTPAGGNRFEVEGTLTIRGIGKPVRLDVTFDPATLDISASSAFKMTSYSLKPPSAALGAIGTRDEMTATIIAKAAK